MATNKRFHSDLAIPPGEYLAEVVEELGVSQAELARRMGRPPQAINEIVLGKKALTPETAIQLENVTGVPARIWTSLEEEYRLALARRDENERRREDAKLVDSDLYRAMVKLGCVEGTRDPLAKARALCKFFGTDSLSYVKDAKHVGYAFRLGDRDGASGFALAAWLRMAELEAKEMSPDPFDATGLQSVIEGLRSLTFELPSRWLPEARERLASVGVALAVIPHLPKTFVNGATFWPSPHKAVVALSLRGSWADIFWFTLFHELGHVLLHGKRDPHVSLRDTQEHEVEADRFAVDRLIPRRAYEEFVFKQEFSTQAVEEFSKTVGIAPGVVVGRLQHDKLVPHDRLNELRERYRFEARAV